MNNGARLVLINAAPDLKELLYRELVVPYNIFEMNSLGPLSLPYDTPDTFAALDSP